MQQITNMQAGGNGGGVTYANSFALVTGDVAEALPFIWCATARDMLTSGTSLPSVAQDAQRTASSCYMKGLSEKLEIVTSSGSPFQWRRIVFTCKDLPRNIPDAPGGTDNNRWEYNFEDTNGSVNRVANVIPGLANSALSPRAQFYDQFFKGTFGTDWTNVNIATVDKSRFSVMSDKTFTIASGNQYGMIKKRSFYTPINKNLRYDDEEQGDSYTTRPYSVNSKIGMGDMYVLDIVTPLIGASNADILRFRFNSTLYWHEK